jgi:ubiquinone/menaquinone biosynthesis C-methylase UbiE
MNFYFTVLALWSRQKNPMYELFFKGKQVLDVGCGEGNLLRKDPEHFYGIDINDTLVQKLQGEGFNVKKGNVTEIPFEANMFDAIDCNNIIEHLTPDEAHKMLREMIRVLRPGGAIVITTPMPSTVWNTFGHIKPYPPSAIKKILRPVSLESFDSITGVSIESLIYYGSWGQNKAAFLLSSTLALWLNRFRGSYTMILRKAT